MVLVAAVLVCVSGLTCASPVVVICVVCAGVACVILSSCVGVVSCGTVACVCLGCHVGLCSSLAGKGGRLPLPAQPVSALLRTRTHTHSMPWLRAVEMGGWGGVEEAK